ncbi:hypothetical protein [Foetidibacter luteolus]|uniref:hypothetical protein n=1 Tax=Foetidibacter luteolus TaxID=2608880 RepID=UPI00129B3007|nr:hypothetical protein [Foetidibacter luteolus]
MKKILLLTLFCSIGTLLHHEAQAQGFLKKLKDKANKAVDKALDKKVEEKTGIPSDDSTDNTNPSSPSSRKGKPTNRTGEGLKNSTPPDVQAQITDAEKAHTEGNFSDARYAIQQALLGVEIQIGREILASLPATINGMAKDTMENRVVSTQWGWSNLTIQSAYKKGEDQQLNISIGNNSFYSGLVNVYFNNTYIQGNGEQQNVKQVKVKGYKSLIQFDESKGYTLLVPLGQTSLIAFECINFANEQEVMTAASAFDIDGIKKMLGEQ